MSTSAITFRVKPDRQHAVRERVDAITDDPGMTVAMLELIRTRPSLVAGTGDDTAGCGIGVVPCRHADFEAERQRLRGWLAER